MDEVKFIIVEKFVVCVGCIVCSDQGREIFSFLTEILMTGKRYVYW